jgi:transcriptional regulator with GAF, ATPase, and Fis domain
MSSALATSQLSADLRDLARTSAAGDSVDALLRRGLDALARVVPYDLATFFELRGEDLVLRAARGAKASAVPAGYTLPLTEFPSIQEALETRRARAFTEIDHVEGDGDPFDGLLDFPPGHACMVVPLYTADRAIGALTLDRVKCERYPDAVVDLVELCGWMLALAVTNAEQRALLQELREGDQARAALFEKELFVPSDLDASEAPAVRDLARRARQVAETDTPVLILGETGTGKERLARFVHEASKRARGPFVKINCAALPDGLLESELFGHTKGAFTGASRDRPGRFQVAEGGTLLLDEVGDLPLPLQAKLLRVLQEGTFEPVGSDRPRRANVRVLAATHVDLRAAIRDGSFREDLYYRLGVFPLTLPPLRERLSDMPRLVTALLAEQAQRTGRSGYVATPATLDKLVAYHWPGNLRELSNALERAVILAHERSLGPELFDLEEPSTDGARRLRAGEPGGSNDEEAGAEPITTLDENERRHILRTLLATGYKLYGKGGAAELLGLPPSTLQSRMKKLGIPGKRSAKSA